MGPMRCFVAHGATRRHPSGHSGVPSTARDRGKGKGECPCYTHLLIPLLTQSFACAHTKQTFHFISFHLFICSMKQLKMCSKEYNRAGQQG